MQRSAEMATGVGGGFGFGIGFLAVLNTAIHWTHHVQQDATAYIEPRITTEPTTPP
ncbi:MAG: hypothetical protein QOH73_2194 [Gaiellaceae bacterium]|jgi:hypothetical protein|nr:hypothetical protein [Gaiellaceae bacterium]